MNISARVRDVTSQKSVFFKKFLHVYVFSYAVLRDALISVIIRGVAEK